MEVKIEELHLDKTISKEYHPYLELILQTTNVIKNPYLITINNKKYIILQEEQRHVIVTENNQIYDLYNIAFDENGNFIGFSKNCTTYQIYLEKEYPYVKKIDLINKKITKLEYGPFLGNNKGLHVVYSQSFLDNIKKLKLQYDASNFEKQNIQYYILYLNKHLPYFISIKKHLLTRNYYQNEENEEEYFESLVLFNHVLSTDRLTEFTLEEIIPPSFEIQVPQEMIDIFNNNNQELNQIQEVSNIYQRLLKR